MVCVLAMGVDPYEKQIIAGLAVIAGVALCATVWPRSAEVEALPDEPIKNAVIREFEARSGEVPHIFISDYMAEPETVVIVKDEPEATAKPVAESEPKLPTVTSPLHFKMKR